MGSLFWLVVAPLIAAILILLLPKLGAMFYRTLAFLGSLVSLVLLLVSWEGFNTQSTAFQSVSKLHWFTLPNLWNGKDLSIGLSFGVDGLSLTLLTLAVVVSLLSILAVKANQERAKEYFFWLSIVSFGLYGVFTALDLFTFLVALEVTLFSTFFLIYLFGEKGRQKAAIKFLIYRGSATVFMLVAFLMIAYGYAGGFASTAGTTVQSPPSGTLTFDIPTLVNGLHHASAQLFPIGVRSAVLIVLLFAVFIEEAFVPFHTWLPTTHEFADTPTSMMVGGILTKTGAYALLRFGVGMLPGEVHRWGTLIAVMGVINILYGAFSAWAQKDWRRLIAFGSISHMGLVLLGIAALNTAGIQGAIFMLVSSGLLTALLFYITGAIRERTHTFQIPVLGGISKSMPMLSGFLLFAALGSLGLPLTSGFISEIQAFVGGFATFPAASFVGIGGLILSAVYLLYAIEKTTFGPPKAKFAELADARAGEYVPIVVLTTLVLIIGIYPAVIGNVIGQSAHALLLGMGV